MWKPGTPGEQLYGLVRRQLENSRSSSSPRMDVWLGWTGRGTEFCEFFVELAAIHTVRRLVEHVRPVARDHDPADPLFVAGTRDGVAEVIVVHDPRLRRRIEDLAGKSAVASFTEISTGVRRRAEREIRNAGRLCYMCGAGFDSSQASEWQRLTLDHVWPRAYGGDSQMGNLLGACESCNSKKKTDFAVWALPGIQALNLGVGPSAERLDELHGTFKYALHRRAVMRLAAERELTLQEAYLEAGPWSEFSVLAEDEAADFFNIGLRA